MAEPGLSSLCIVHWPRTDLIVSSPEKCLPWREENTIQLRLPVFRRCCRLKATKLALPAVADTRMLRNTVLRKHQWFTTTVLSKKAQSGPGYRTRNCACGEPFESSAPEMPRLQNTTRSLLRRKTSSNCCTSRLNLSRLKYGPNWPFLVAKSTIKKI